MFFLFYIYLKTMHYCEMITLFEHFINRLNESLNDKYPFPNIIIAIHNVDELKKAMPYLNKYISPYSNLYKDVEFSFERPRYIRLLNSGHYIVATYGSLYRMEDSDFNYKYEKLFSVEDLKNGLLDNIKRHGTSAIPNYKPKNFNRTLESLNEGVFHEDYPYNSVAIEIKTQDELDEIYHILNLEDMSMYDSVLTYLKRYTIPYLRLYVDGNNTDNIKLSCGTASEIERLSRNLGYTYEKLFTLKDVQEGLINSIKRYGKFMKNPTYTPKKFDRTLEQSSLVESIKPIKQYPYRFRTEEEFEKKFGGGWKKDIVFTWNSPNMDYLFGKDYPYFIDKNVESDDDLPYIDAAPFSEREWMISWDMLTPNKPKVPNYKPRKFDRTLESINTSDIRYIPVKVEDQEELNRLLSMLATISPQFVRRDYFYGLEYPNWIFVDLEKDNDIYQAARKWNTRSKEEAVINYVANTDNCFKRIFTIKELSSVKSYILTGSGIVPSYAPKKFDRTLDSLNESKYYNTHGYYCTFAEMKKLEVNERENHTDEDFEEWKEKYNISDDDEVIWVTKLQKDALRYIFPAEDWDDIYSMNTTQIKKLMKERDYDDDLYIINSSEGFLIPESDDGDGGFIFVKR